MIYKPICELRHNIEASGEARAKRQLSFISKFSMAFF